VDFKGRVIDRQAFKAASKCIAKSRLSELGKILADKPDLLNYSERAEGTLLHIAVTNNKPDLIKYLLGLGADPNASARPGQTYTPLVLATSCPFLEVV